MFNVASGVSLKGMGESCLLSKEERLTLNIDGVMAFKFLEIGPETRKIGENWTSRF